ncbi:unnamed protein product [Candida verbasci]|uniref:Nucleoporin Nup159/Nup146 N-terminal domain-containing protein n=1 Tax=Candida verbasci TaxID=1227364 RepID=A0A9W4XLN0_9ASCO|nr:unnamed protein product [Candida verbasci]
MIEEIISEDLGFKLYTTEHGISIFDDPISFEEIGDHILNLLAIDNENKIIAASNHKSLKIITTTNLDDITTIGDDFKITQVYFHQKKLIILNNDKIQSLSIDQIKSKDYTFSTIEEGQFISVKPTSEGILKLTTSNELYLDSSLIATNVSTFFNKSIYAYTKDSSKLGTLPIKIENEDLSSYNIIDVLQTSKNAYFTVFNNAEEEITRTFLLHDSNGEFVGDEVDIVPQFGEVERKSTYYNANISNWFKSDTFSILTSSGSTELGIIETTNKEEQVISFEEDISRANLPLDDETGDDCSPIGLSLGIDLDAKALEPCPGVDEAIGKLPKVYCLLHTGTLVIWWVYHKAGLLNDGLRLELPKEEQTTEKPVEEKGLEAESKQSVELNPFGSTQSSAFKGGFGATAFGNKTATPVTGGGGFGQTSFGATGFASQKEQQKSNPSLTSGFGSFAKSNQQSNFGSFGGNNNGRSIFGDSNSGKSEFKSSPFAISSGTSILGDTKTGSIVGDSRTDTDKKLSSQTPTPTPVYSEISSTSSSFVNINKESVNINKEGEEATSTEIDKKKAENEDKKKSSAIKSYEVGKDPSKSSPFTQELNTQVQNLKEEKKLSLFGGQRKAKEEPIKESKPETKSYDEVKPESKEDIQAEDVKPVEFLIFDGFIKPLPKSTSIKEQLIHIIQNTEGDLNIFKENVKRLSYYIAHVEINPPSLIDVDFTKTISNLHKEEELLSNLVTKISKSQQERIKLDKLFSQLVVYSKNQTKFKEILKNRPLDFKYEMIQSKLRDKLEFIKKLEEKLISLLMPIKFRNSINDKTISNIEKLIFPINEQINEHKKIISDLTKEIDHLTLDNTDTNNLQLAITKSSTPLSSKLKLRQMLVSK